MYGETVSSRELYIYTKTLCGCLIVKVLIRLWITQSGYIILRIGDFNYCGELHSFVDVAAVRMSVFYGQVLGLPMGRWGFYHWVR